MEQIEPRVAVSRSKGKGEMRKLTSRVSRSNRSEVSRMIDVAKAKIKARDGHFQARLKPILRQITFDSVALDGFGIHNEQSRRPQRIESLEPCGMFFDVGFERYEGLMNEICDFLI